MEKKLVGFGELLLRLDAPGNLRLSQAEHLQAKYTGGEANVLVAAKNFGIQHCEMVSCVPANAIGNSCLEFLSRYGIGTEQVTAAGDRLGILFVETGASVRPTKVVYDRLHTSFRNSDPDIYDWNKILDGAGIVHITGTAPALGERVNESINRCIASARQVGCLVSFDCSYRSALWSIDQAAQAYQRIAPQVDLLFATPGDAHLFFGIGDQDDDQRIQSLINDFGICRVAYTDRVETSASSNRLSGYYWRSGQKFSSREYEFDIVDRIGSGDAFAGGVIASLLNDKDDAELVEFATAAAVLKHTVFGDFCLVSSSEVDELVQGESLRIRR